MSTRLFFCTDLHGSEVCFRKFLHAGAAYDAQVVIMGGDCTGKMVVPIVEVEDSRYECEWAGQAVELSTEEELVEQERMIQNNGLYPVRMTQDEFQAIAEDEARRAGLFSETMLATLKRWMALAEERLLDSRLQVIVTPGNDDEFSVDQVLEESDFILSPEGRVTEVVGGHEMLSVGWSNPTPWDTPRECSEEELAAKIEEQAGQIERMDRAIFNIHVPPFGTGLDAAPELESATSYKRGGAITASVGSSAVREAIERYQPLLSLHGHIHESRGVQRLGRTVCINPGSAYSDWTLQGVVVDLNDTKVKRYVPVTG